MRTFATLLFCCGIAVAESAFGTEFETRVEMGIGPQWVGVFSPARSKNSDQWTTNIRATVQIERLAILRYFTDPDILLKAGAYANIASAGNTYKIGGGGAFGIQYARFEFIGNLGIGYFGDNLGSFSSNNRMSAGQTRITYEINGKLLFHPNDRWYGGIEWSHNSNGDKIGLDGIAGKGENHGVDAALAIIGFTF